MCAHTQTCEWSMPVPSSLTSSFLLFSGIGFLKEPCLELVIVYLHWLAARPWIPSPGVRTVCCHAPLLTLCGDLRAAPCLQSTCCPPCTDSPHPHCCFCSDEQGVEGSISCLYCSYFCLYENPFLCKRTKICPPQKVKVGTLFLPRCSA